MGRDYIHKVNLDKLSCFIPDVGYVEYYSQWRSFKHLGTQKGKLIIQKYSAKSFILKSYLFNKLI